MPIASNAASTLVLSKRLFAQEKSALPWKSFPPDFTTALTWTPGVGCSASPPVWRRTSSIVEESHDTDWLAVRAAIPSSVYHVW